MLLHGVAQQLRETRQRHARALPQRREGKSPHEELFNGNGDEDCNPLPHAWRGERETMGGIVRRCSFALLASSVPTTTHVQPCLIE